MTFANDQRPTTNDASPQLIRGIGLSGATALNMIDMIGVGPFITIPLIVGAMGGPQAMLGWIAGALLATCDGLVTAELSSAMPGSGGTYRFLREIYGPNRLGRLISFLFIWQLSFSAPLSIASGSIGLAGYASYFFPSLEYQYAAHTWSARIPLLGALQVRWMISGATLVAIAMVLLAVLLLYRRITSIGWMSKLLLAGVVGTMAWIIISGFTHFHRDLAFNFPPGAFHLSNAFFTGLGAAMLVASYDYWGYYNICYLGDEVKNPDAHHSAGHAAIHFAGGVSIPCDEPQHSGGIALAANRAIRAVHRRPVCDFHFHGENLRSLGGQAGGRFGRCGLPLLPSSR